MMSRELREGGPQFASMLEAASALEQQMSQFLYSRFTLNAFEDD